MAFYQCFRWLINAYMLLDALAVFCSTLPRRRKCTHESHEFVDTIHIQKFPGSLDEIEPHQIFCQWQMPNCLRFDEPWQSHGKVLIPTKSKGMASSQWQGPKPHRMTLVSLSLKEAEVAKWTCKRKVCLATWRQFCNTSWFVQQDFGEFYVTLRYLFLQVF